VTVTALVAREAAALLAALALVSTAVLLSTAVLARGTIGRLEMVSESEVTEIVECNGRWLCTA